MRSLIQPLLPLSRPDWPGPPATLLATGVLGRNALGGAAGEAFDHRTQDHQAINRAERCFHCALRMRHQTDDIALAIAEAGDRGERTVWIGIKIVGTGVATVGVD